MVFLGSFLNSISLKTKIMGIQITDKITDDMFVVVTRVEDFDEKSNSFWTLEANKSYARESMVCFTCKKPIVMSNFAYSQNPKKEKIVCLHCLPDVSRETQK